MFDRKEIEVLKSFYSDVEEILSISQNMSYIFKKLGCPIKKEYFYCNFLSCLRNLFEDSPHLTYKEIDRFNQFLGFLFKEHKKRKSLLYSISNRKILVNKIGDLVNKDGTLDKKIKTLVNKFKTLVNENETLINQIGTVINKLEAIDNEIRNFKGTIIIFDRNYQKFANKTFPLQYEFEDLEKKIKIIDNKIGALVNKIKTLVNGNGTIDKKIKTLVNKIGTLVNKNKVLDNEFKTFINKIWMLFRKNYPHASFIADNYIIILKFGYMFRDNFLKIRRKEVEKIISQL